MRAVIHSMYTVLRLVILFAIFCGCRPAGPLPPDTLTHTSQPVSAPTSQPTSAATPTSQPTSGPVSASQPAPRPVTPLPPAKNGVQLGKNNTGIDYQSSERSSCDGTQPCSCAAPTLFHGLSALTRIGIHKEDLQPPGTPCLLADFDGNGITDAAFFEATTQPERRVLVLMFDDVGLSSVEELPKPVAQLNLIPGPNKALLSSGENLVFVYSKNRFRLGVVPTQPQSTD